MFCQTNFFSFVGAAVLLALAGKAPASSEGIERPPGMVALSAAFNKAASQCRRLISQKKAPIADLSTRLVVSAQNPFGDLTEFVTSNGLSDWFLFLGKPASTNHTFSSDLLSRLSDQIGNYSAEVDRFIDSPDVPLDRKLRVLIYNIAFVSQLVRYGSDEVAHVLRSRPAVVDFMVRQLQWLQHPGFTDLILFAYSHFESVKAAGGAGPIAIPYSKGVASVVSEGSLATGSAKDPSLIPHFGTFKLASMRSVTGEPTRFIVKPDFVSLGALDSLFEKLLSPRQSARVVAETALLIYTIYSRSLLSVQDSQLQKKFAFLNKKGSRVRPSKERSRFPLRRLIEETLGSSLVSFRTHPLITLFFLQLDVRLFQTVQQTGRRLSFKKANVLNIISPLFARVLDFNVFGDLFALEDPTARPGSPENISEGRLLRADYDPRIALYMGEASGYASREMKDKEFLRTYFRRLERILASKGLKSDVDKSLDSDRDYFHFEPHRHAIHALPSGDGHSPSSDNPLVYNLPSSVARSMIVSLLDWFLKSETHLTGIMVNEILSFRIGPVFMLHDSEGRSSTQNPGGDFASQAQFLRKTFGILSELPTSESLNTPPSLRTLVIEAERKAYQHLSENLGQVRETANGDFVSSTAVYKTEAQPGALIRTLGGFPNWKSVLRASGTGATQEPNPPQKGTKEGKRVARFSPAPSVEVDIKGYSHEFQDQTLKTSSLSARHELDHSASMRYSIARLVQSFKAQIERIDADVGAIHAWAMAMGKDSEDGIGIVHWMNYVKPWPEIVGGVDVEDLVLVIDRTLHDLQLYFEVKGLWEKNENTQRIRLIPTQLEKRIELTREIRDSLISIFEHLTFGNPEGARTGDELHRIQIRMIHIGLEWPRWEG